MKAYIPNSYNTSYGNLSFKNCFENNFFPFNFLCNQFFFLTIVVQTIFFQIFLPADNFFYQIRYPPVRKIMVLRARNLTSNILPRDGNLTGSFQRHQFLGGLLALPTILETIDRCIIFNKDDIIDHSLCLHPKQARLFRI